MHVVGLSRRNFNYSPDILDPRGLQRLFSYLISIDPVLSTEDFSDDIQSKYGRGMWI